MWHLGAQCSGEGARAQLILGFEHLGGLFHP